MADAKFENFTDDDAFDTVFSSLHHDHKNASTDKNYKKFGEYIISRKPLRMVQQVL